MPRKSFVGGNWKCTGTLESIATLVGDLNNLEPAKNVDVCVTPSTLHLLTVNAKLSKNYLVGAQNCSATGKGAFTGETSAEMLKDASIPWVVIGHSERRTLYGDTDQVVAAKVAIALKTGLSVIACIGETLQQREAGEMLAVITRQAQAVAEVVGDWSRVVLAYEPVWAIGTGKVASNEQAQEAHQQLRAWIATHYSKKIAEHVRIIYGGSVKPSSAAGLIAQPDIDGFLVGGASLKGKDFGQIISHVAAHGPRSKL